MSDDKEREEAAKAAIQQAIDKRAIEQGREAKAKIREAVKDAAKGGKK